MKKKNIKLVACLSLTGFLALCGLPYMNNSPYNIGIMETQAAEITNTWESGNTTVTLDSEGTLTVTAKPGTDGVMADYEYPTNPSWYQNDKINSIVISEGVTVIGERAFMSSTAINLSLPNSLTIINSSAFRSSNIKKVILPNTDKLMLKAGCFAKCTQLEEVIFPNHDMKFRDGGDAIFSECTAIKEINIPAGFNPLTINTDGLSWKENFIGLFEYNNIEKITVEGDDRWIQDYTNNTLVSKDGTMWFWLSTSVIPSYVKKIVRSTSPIDKNVTTVIIPENVESIEYGAFKYAPNLKSIYIANDNLSFYIFTGDSNKDKKIEFYCNSESSVASALKEAGYNVYESSSKLLTTNIVYGRIEDSLNFNFFINPLKPKDSIESIFINDFKISAEDYSIFNSELKIYNDALNNIPNGHSVLTVLFSSGDISTCDIYSSTEPSTVFESGNTYITLDNNGVLTVIAKEGTDGKMGANFSDFLDDSYDVNKVIIDDSVTSLAIFGDMTVDEFIIGSGIKDIKDYTFLRSNIGKIKLNNTIKEVGIKVFASAIIGELYWDIENYSSYSNQFDVFNLAKVDELIFGENVKTFQQMGAISQEYVYQYNASINILKYYCDTVNVHSLNAKTIISFGKFLDTPSITNLDLRDFYILGDVAATVKPTYIPKNVLFHVKENSIGKTWCVNNSLDYVIITDDEIDELQNGKRPVINQFNLNFDKQNPSDLQFDFDLGSGQLGAKSIKNIIINGKKLIKNTDFTITDSTITLKKEIFETLTNDTYQVTVIFDNEYTVDDKVKVIVYGEDVILTPDKTVPKQTIYMDKTNLEDAYFTVYCDSIDKVIINNKQLKTEEWELKEKTKLLRNGSTEKPKELIIKKDFIQNLKSGKYEIIVVTEGVSIENQIYLFITGEDEEDNTQPPIILDTINYEFYKDYPDFIIIPFSFNRANAITKVEIGNNELTTDNYEITKSTIVIDKDYILGLDTGKYRISITFDDNTIRSNAQLIVYEKAADRAAPYLLQSHIIFNGNSINLTFDPGEGDLQTTNVLALVLDDKLILPNGDKVPFNSSNINKLQKAYKDYVNEDDKTEVASSSNAKKEETNINNSENNNNNEINDSEETNTNEDEIINNKDNKTVDSENANTDKKESINNKEEDNLIKVDVEQVESNSFNLFATLDDYDTVFVTNGTEIVLDGAYIESLKLSEGDHLIGAIFDNTERTTDVKKVILTIPKPDSGDKPTPPDDGDKEEPVDPPKPDEGDKEEPVNPIPKPDEGNKPTPPDNNNGGGSSGGGSSSGGSGGSNSKPDNSKPSPINPDGSLNPDYKPVVPDTGGKFEGNGDDWTYIKPDGNQAKNEWVGDGEDWYYIDENSKLKYDWALINNEWYMLNREHDGKFGAAKYGWYKENQDGQWYFMNPKDTKMLTGWQKINHKWYYFNVNQEEPTYYGDNQSGWKYDITKVAIRPHGSMYVNEITPDGYKTNEKGEWIE